MKSPQTGSWSKRQRTPDQARSGVISGRVLLVLVASSLGALAALGIAWWLGFSLS